MTDTLHGTWVWDVAAVKSQFDLQDYLGLGWEPFAVTTNVHGEYVYHLRRKRKSK